MANTIYSGSTGTIYIDDTAVASLRSFSIEETQEVIDATTMSVTGVAFRSNKPTFKAVNGSAEVFWSAIEPADGAGNHDDKNITSGANAIADTQPGSTEVTVNFWPTGDDQYEIGYSFPALITSRTISSSVDGMVEASITFTGTGAITKVNGTVNDNGA